MINVVIAVSIIGLAAIVLFVLDYTTDFDWHRSHMGVAMNVSLLSCVLTTTGYLVLLAGATAGGVLVILGWVVFLGALVWRAVLLRGTAKLVREHRKK